MTVDDTNRMPGHSVLVMGSIAGAFVAGFVGIVIFHQVSGWLLHLAGLYPPQYKTQPIPPFGVPQIVSQCFWGGLWGIVLAWTVAAIKIFGNFTGPRPIKGLRVP